jgi:asparagine synthase (glutamine-hydrolysing)
MNERDGAGLAGITSWAARVGTALEEAITALLTRAGPANLGLLYSAGLDSALLARLCQDLGYVPLLLSLGTDRSRDREFVERSRAYLDLPVEFIAIGESDIARALVPVQELLQRAGVFSDFEKLNRIHLSIGVGIYLACRAAQNREIKLLLSAHGADALFAGFDRYRRVPRHELSDRLQRDVEEAIQTGLTRDQAVADAFSITILAPFLEPRVVEVGLAIPAQLKLGPRGNKLVLRELARQRGLPGFVARRPKRSMQYSTGIWTVLRGLQPDA